VIDAGPAGSGMFVESTASGVRACERRVPDIRRFSVMSCPDGAGGQQTRHHLAAGNDVIWVPSGSRLPAVLRPARRPPNPTGQTSCSPGGRIVGSIVGRIALIRWCRAVGIAGGEDKCRWRGRRGRFDAANRLQGCRPSVKTSSTHAPDGVDVYFENNVGGRNAGAALNRLAHGARIVSVVRWSQYKHTPRGPANYMQLLVAGRASIDGNSSSSNYAELTRKALRNWLVAQQRGRIHETDRTRAMSATFTDQPSASCSSAKQTAS